MAFVTIPVLGRIRITASDAGVKGITFLRGRRHGAGGGASCAATHLILDKAAKELRLYARHLLKDFSVPVDMTAVSGFTRLVLEEVRRVRYGRTVSYQQLASALGSARAARAVGNSLGRNPVPIIIPCHRVVRANGSLGGFSSGVEIKKKLLRIEKAGGGRT